MAATRLIPIHVSKGKTIAQTLFYRTNYVKNPDKTVGSVLNNSIDYVMNPDKTNGGGLVDGYACNPHTVDMEFLLAKKEYEYLTGRSQGSRNILAYHMRQSFKPGEIEPQEALDIGYELAMRFTKGRHAFIVAVHTDKAHIHCHIVFNSTSLDYTRKFKNFWGSSFAVRRLSDLICAEHELSVIDNPKPSRGENYGKWLGDNKKPSFNEIIKNKIDEILPTCPTFEDFISILRSSGFTVNDKRRNISVCAPGQERPTRLNSIGGGYTEAAISTRLGRARFITGDSDSGTHTRVSLLVDIQAKIREGKGSGYEQWSKIFNLKQAAKTLIFLQENGIDSYEDLQKKSLSASNELTALTAKIKEVETHQSKISELQKHIGQYSKTRDIYTKYKASGWNRNFYDEHAAEIILHKASKKYFDVLGIKKLPSINQLRQEWAALAAEKKKLYSTYHKLKNNSHALSVAKGNANRILGITQETQYHNDMLNQTRHNSYEI